MNQRQSVPYRFSSNPSAKLSDLSSPSKIDQMLELDRSLQWLVHSRNVRDHRTGTGDHPFLSYAQVTRRAHHIFVRLSEP